MASTNALARRRQGLLIAAALGYLLWQGSQLFLALMPSASPAKPALTVASILGVLTFLGAFSGVFLWAKAARCQPALEDEMTRHNRSRSSNTGYWVMLMTATALFALAQFIFMPAAEVARLVMVVGVVVPLLRFALLERAVEP